MFVYESFFIGYYVILIYFILWLLLFSHININILFQLFIIGFFKHFISYYIGLHNYFCNHNKKKENHILFIESLIEGFLFVLIGSLLLLLLKKNKFLLSLFIIGFLLHLFNNMNGIHSYFCSHTFI